MPLIHAKVDATVCSTTTIYGDNEGRQEVLAKLEITNSKLEALQMAAEEFREEIAGIKTNNADMASALDRIEAKLAANEGGLSAAETQELLTELRDARTGQQAQEDRAAALGDTPATTE
jgi:predicted  nucleic acid-binding Zn-ribbon protein